jgi:hypothetical protein
MTIRIMRNSTGFKSISINTFGSVSGSILLNNRNISLFNNLENTRLNNNPKSRIEEKYR